MKNQRSTKMKRTKWNHGAELKTNVAVTALMSDKTPTASPTHYRLKAIPSLTNNCAVAVSIRNCRR